MKLLSLFGLSFLALSAPLFANAEQRCEYSYKTPPCYQKIISCRSLSSDQNKFQITIEENIVREFDGSPMHVGVNYDTSFTFEDKTYSFQDNISDGAQFIHDKPREITSSYWVKSKFSHLTVSETGSNMYTSFYPTITYDLRVPVTAFGSDLKDKTDLKIKMTIPEVKIPHKHFEWIAGRGVAKEEFAFNGFGFIYLFASNNHDGKLDYPIVNFSCTASIKHQ